APRAYALATFAARPRSPVAAATDHKKLLGTTLSRGAPFERRTLMDDNSTGSSEMTTTTPLEAPQKPRKPRGFAAMDPKLVSELATRGGKAAHRAGTAHEFTSEEARAAGRKGALATHAKRRARAAAAAAAATNGGTNVQ